MKSVNSHAEFKWNMTSEHRIQVRSREFKLHEHTIIFTDDLCFYWRATSGSHLVPPADLLTETNAVWGRYLDNHIPLHQAKNVQSKSCKTASIGGLLKIPASEIHCGTSFLEEKNWHRRCIKSGAWGTNTVWTQTGSCAFMLSLMWLSAWTWFFLLLALLVWSIQVNYGEGNPTGHAAQLWFLRRNFPPKGVNQISLYESKKTNFFISTSWMAISSTPTQLNWRFVWNFPGTIPCNGCGSSVKL